MNQKRCIKQKTQKFKKTLIIGKGFTRKEKRKNKYHKKFLIK